MSMAWPARPVEEINWSMMPQFTPIHLFSDRCPSLAWATASQAMPLDGGKGPGGGHLQRGRGRKSRPQRHVAGQHAFPAAEIHAGVLKAPGNALEILDPAGLLVLQAGDVELAGFLVVDRVDLHAAVAARPQGDPGGPIDGQRQHEAVVVIGVLADQVDSPRGPHDKRGACPKRSVK